MALAEYVQQLEGKLAKQQADSAGHQGAQDSHTGGQPVLSLTSLPVLCRRAGEYVQPGPGYTVLREAFGLT